MEEVEAVEKDLMQTAQRYFTLTQTDNLWKEHLQVLLHTYLAQSTAGSAAPLAACQS